MDNLRRMMFVKESEIYGKGITFSELNALNNRLTIKGLWIPAIFDSAFYTKTDKTVSFVDLNTGNTINPPSDYKDTYYQYKLTINSYEFIRGQSLKNGQLYWGLGVVSISTIPINVAIGSSGQGSKMRLPIIGTYGDGYERYSNQIKYLFDTNEKMYLYIPLNITECTSGSTTYNNAAMAVNSGWNVESNGYKFYFEPA